MMTKERILDILTRKSDYYGPLYRKPDSTDTVTRANLYVNETDIVDVCEFGPDSAVVIWKSKNAEQLRYVAQTTLIVNGRVQLTMLANAYMTNSPIRILNGDYAMTVPASAAGYLAYFASIGSGYRLIDKEYDDNEVVRLTRYNIRTLIYNDEHYNPRIYSICPIGGTGTVIVQYSVKRDDLDPKHPMSKFIVISNEKIVNRNILPDGEHAIAYVSSSGETRKVYNASDYADMWLSYAFSNPDGLQNLINDAVAKAKSAEPATDETPAEKDSEEYTAEGEVTMPAQ